MLLHEKMVSANAETISNKIFYFFTVYLTAGTSDLRAGIKFIQNLPLL